MCALPLGKYNKTFSRINHTSSTIVEHYCISFFFVFIFIFSLLHTNVRRFAHLFVLNENPKFHFVKMLTASKWKKHIFRAHQINLYLGIREKLNTPTYILGGSRISAKLIGFDWHTTRIRFPVRKFQRRHNSVFIVRGLLWNIFMDIRTSLY